VRVFDEDHNPPHVHVYKSGSRIKILLTPVAYEGDINRPKSARDHRYQGSLSDKEVNRASR
jgi:hypothetical protein